MTGLVVHDHALAAQRDAQANALALERARRQNPGGYSIGRPDENSPFMRQMRASTVERTIQLREQQSRDAAEEQEDVRPYNRKKDYYKTLRLGRDCSAAEVRRAYRRLSLRCHPDKQLGKSERQRALAATLFEELKEAHHVLSHEVTRREYDQVLGVYDLLERDGKHNFEDVESTLRAVRPPPRRPPPRYYEVEVTLEELLTGCVKRVAHERCVGGGPPRRASLVVRVPRGAASGTEFLFRRAGDSPVGAAAAGDVVCVLREAAHASRAAGQRRPLAGARKSAAVAPPGRAEGSARSCMPTAAPRSLLGAARKGPHSPVAARRPRTAGRRPCACERRGRRGGAAAAAHARPRGAEARRPAARGVSPAPPVLALAAADAPGAPPHCGGPTQQHGRLGRRQQGRPAPACRPPRPGVPTAQQRADPRRRHGPRGGAHARRKAAARRGLAKTRRLGGGAAVRHERRW